MVQAALPRTPRRVVLFSLKHSAPTRQSFSDSSYNRKRVYMRPRLQLLIVSSRIQTKRALLDAVKGLPINAYTSPTIERAWEVMLHQSIDIVFCDDRLADGYYADFLRAVRSEHRMTRFVVLLSSDDWEDFLEAMRLGATDILRGSWQPTDVELVLIRAGREVGQTEVPHLSAPV